MRHIRAKSDGMRYQCKKTNSSSHTRRKWNLIWRMVFVPIATENFRCSSILFQRESTYEKILEKNNTDKEDKNMFSPRSNGDNELISNDAIFLANICIKRFRKYKPIVLTKNIVSRRSLLTFTTMGSTSSKTVPVVPAAGPVVSTEGFARLEIPYGYVYFYPGRFISREISTLEEHSFSRRRDIWWQVYLSDYVSAYLPHLGS